MATAPEQRKMVWGLVQQWSQDPRTRHLLATIIKDRKPPPRDGLALARAVQSWAQDNVRYTREAEETIAAPWRTAQWGIGDCDDLACLIASVLRNARMPVRLASCGWSLDPRIKPSFTHIYARAFPRDAWVTLEAVRPVPLGFDPALLHAAQGHRVRVAEIGDATPTQPVSA